MLRRAILFGIAMSATSEVRADQVIGLLTVPEVFGREACDRFEPEEVPIYGKPNVSDRIGSIRVEKYWTFHAIGGCEGLEVTVHMSGRPVSFLPAREYKYEARAAIVLERRGHWFKVKLSEGFAWLQSSARDEFHSLETLLTDGLFYLTTEFDGNLRQAPGSRIPAPPGGRLQFKEGHEPPVQTIEFRHVDGQLWVQVEVMSHSICTSDEPPTVIRKGWLPAHAPSGEPTIWFYSRGC